MAKLIAGEEAVICPVSEIVIVTRRAPDGDRRTYCTIRGIETWILTQDIEIFRLATDNIKITIEGKPNA